MSTNVEILRTRFEHEPERFTLFSVCCPCFRPRKFKCRASDIALMMYEKDEPHEYVVEKLVIKRVPLRLFGLDEDFQEYEEETRQNSKISVEREVAVTNLDESEPKKNEVEVPTVEIAEDPLPSTIRTQNELTDVTSANSLNVNYDTQLDSKLSFVPFSPAKEGDELMLRTITANEEIVTEIDQRIAKMSPDLEKTINVLKGVKPRPVSTQGTPLPIKNQRKRLTTRDVEHEGIITKEAYNYTPCKNDNPLQGIHYSLDKSTFMPIMDESSKSIITEVVVEETKMVEVATTNYEDATVLAEAIPSVEQSLTVVETPHEASFWSDSASSAKKIEYGDEFSVFRVEEEPKQNLKWKIVINNHPRDVVPPTTSTSDFQLQTRRKVPKRKRFWKSRRSN